VLKEALLAIAGRITILAGHILSDTVRDKVGVIFRLAKRAGRCHAPASCDSSLAFS
jgi:hypothetical protein